MAVVQIVVEFTGRAVVEIDQSLIAPSGNDTLDAISRHIAEDEVSMLAEDSLHDVRLEIQTSWIDD